MHKIYTLLRELCEFKTVYIINIVRVDGRIIYLIFSWISRGRVLDEWERNKYY